MSDTQGPPQGSSRGPRNAHSHMWLMGVAGVLAGAGMMIFLPQLKIASTSILLFAGFHVLGAIVLIASAWSAGVRGWVQRLIRPAAKDGYDFGWGPGWMNGLAIAALVAATAAIVIELQWPALWPLGFIAVALAIVLMTGNQIMQGFQRPDHVVLPMVDLIRGEAPLVLDAGCGAGRTTIALSRVLGAARVVAVDRFDAGYIDGGGRELLRHNLERAGLSGRVDVQSADLTALPFAEGRFDAAVSTHVYDHLGAGKQKGLEEAFRVLRPGGRFLMAVWTPGLTMFAVANVFSLLLTSKAGWRRMARAAGFQVIDEGAFNGAWFVLLEKPAAVSGATAA
ncbi:class I SAM-dependent methyltransferase [Caulobacter sp. KR2-114]|uniref:class I SAM-dependent methyltransferase n=1 Tax=Caulobacter sp. KR2-114 TaxID=3400912 RepID=UPI003C0160C5